MPVVGNGADGDRVRARGESSIRRLLRNLCGEGGVRPIIRSSSTGIPGHGEGAPRTGLHWRTGSRMFFWPGPLTLVLPRSPRIPDIVTAGGTTVGIRWPQHPFMQGLIRAWIPARRASANLSNRLSRPMRPVLQPVGRPGVPRCGWRGLQRRN